MLNNRKILLIGTHGQVGSELLCTLQNIGKVIPSTLKVGGKNFIDLADYDSICKTIREIKPDIIVNAAAYTAVDKAEQEIDLAMAVNGIAPGILAEEAKKLNAALIHYSTDYVFSGENNKPYTEDDLPEPQSIYGKSKLAGDKAIESIAGNYFIFRTSWVYGLYGSNFLLTMQRLAREREELRIVSDQIGAPTWSRLIAEATGQVLTQLYSPLLSKGINELVGIYNLTSTGETNWYEFAKAIVKTSQKPPKVYPLTSAEYPTPAKRPTYSVLSNDKLAKVFGVNIPNWEKSLCVCLQCKADKLISCAK
jgi:dTDP-4-dehydrorhamnose reductase